LLRRLIKKPANEIIINMIQRECNDFIASKVIMVSVQRGKVVNFGPSIYTLLRARA